METRKMAQYFSSTEGKCQPRTQQKNPSKMKENEDIHRLQKIKGIYLQHKMKKFWNIRKE